MPAYDNDPDLMRMYYQSKLQDNNLVIYQLDSKEIVLELHNKLSGREWNETKGIYEQIRKPLLNDKGVSFIISTLDPRTTRIFSLSNYQMEEIDKSTIMYINNLTFALMRNMWEYGIEDTQMLDCILDICDDLYMAQLLRAKDAGERDTIRKGWQTIEHKESPQPQQSSGGFLGLNKMGLFK